MAQVFANRDMTLNGRDYKRGQPLTAKDLGALPRGRLKKLIDQRRVSEDRVSVQQAKE